MEHRIDLTCGDKRYRGYLRNLRDNEFTAFVRIPCAIPADLLDAANKGTVSKFTVMSEGDKPEPVAELVFSSTVAEFSETTEDEEVEAPAPLEPSSAGSETPRRWR